jgi:type I restriction enzyme S subunit
MARGPGVIIGRKGTLGTVHYVDTDYWPHDTTLWVSQFRGNLPRFVYYKLLSMNLERLDTGSANPTLNRNLVHPIRVSWPPVHAQSYVVDVLEALSEQTKRVSGQILTQLDRLREYRQALISGAVTGKVDVTKAQGTSRTRAH